MFVYNCYTAYIMCHNYANTNIMNGLLLTDGYKTGHHQQYPKGTEEVYSNWTPRSNKYAPKGCDKVVSFGQQYVIKWLHDYFDDIFFQKTKKRYVMK